jgi:hypothetical protein
MIEHKVSSPTTARLATLDELIEKTLPVFISRIPCKITLRTWFDEAAIPRIKNNPQAKRGGGYVFYSVAHVEKYFRSRMLPGRLVNS